MQTPHYPSASIHRSVETQAAYVAYREQKQSAGDTSCDMCRLAQNNPVNNPVLENLHHVCIIENEFPYETYDGHQIVSHHMLTPIEHVSTSSQLADEVKQELRDAQDILLDSGVYDGSFVRSTYSPTTSVPAHLHIHMVKLGAKVIKQDYDAHIGKNDLEYEPSSES